MLPGLSSPVLSGAIRPSASFVKIYNNSKIIEPGKN